MDSERVDLDMRSGNSSDSICVAVWMVTYNHQEYIQQAIESVVTQETDFRYQLFIGEDCSTDRTRDICKQMKLLYPDKIELILNETNLGPAENAANIYKACYRSGAKYIAMLEGDDYWVDRLKLQKQVEILDKNQEIIVCHHWQKFAVLKDSEFIETEAPRNGHGYLNQSIASVRDIFANRLRVKTRTMMFRNIVGDNFFPCWFSKVAFGDVPLNFLLGQRGKFYFLNEEMAVYRQTAKGLSTNGIDAFSFKVWFEKHQLNWIEIWDYADNHYKSKYCSEAYSTVFGFYRSILENHDYSFSSLIRILSHRLVRSKAAFHKRLKMVASLCFIYFKGMLSSKTL